MWIPPIVITAFVATFCIGNGLALVTGFFLGAWVVMRTYDRMVITE